MEGKSQSGSESATMRAGSLILSLSCSSLQERTHRISTIISTGKRRKSDSSEADCISTTAKKEHLSFDGGGVLGTNFKNKNYGNSIKIECES